MQVDGSLHLFPPGLLARKFKIFLVCFEFNNYMYTFN